MEQTMKIRKTTMKDFDTVLKLYEHARNFMKEHGNPSQWGTTYPPASLVEEDILQGSCYLCEYRRNYTAVFYYREGADPDYDKIYHGAWLNNKPYGVVHRIVSAGTIKGSSSFCLNWALNQCGNLKIDTHRDNTIMQNLLAKNGFTLCGYIRLANGSERLAYQKCNV